ncbi:MAG: GDP-mannose 4,6-dehydratase [Patescibacteria group bacterium]
MNNKRALITGITGQDGSYLVEFLLEKGYEVFGFYRRTSTPNISRIKHLLDKIYLIPGDLTDQTSITYAIKESRPSEIYNLGAQSFVESAFETAVSTAEVDALGPVRILESIKLINPAIKFYQASTSEMYGKVQEIPQTEKTPFYPRSPYGAAKLYAHWATINYREAYGMHASCGILFNHESPRRGEEFVTKKVARYTAAIKYSLVDHIPLGNIDAKRDWGYAKDFVEAMWLMLQQDKPDDFVIATGETHTVREFLEEAFKVAGITDSYEKYVKIMPEFLRPAEVDILLGDPSKAKEKLGWKPKTKFKELVKIMTEAELENLKDVKEFNSRKPRIHKIGISPDRPIEPLNQTHPHPK